jgi:hypothetical protein
MVKISDPIKSIMEPNDLVSRLPQELLLLIVAHLETQDLCSFVRVCRTWQLLLSAPYHWRSLNLNSLPQSSVNALLRRSAGELVTVSISHCFLLTTQLWTALGAATLKKKLVSFTLRIPSISIFGQDQKTCTAAVEAVSGESLRNLHLDTCLGVCDGMVRGIIQNSPHLQALTLRKCLMLSDECLSPPPDVAGLAASSLRQLEMLRLGYCPKLTDRFLDSIASRRPPLKHLVIEGELHGFRQPDPALFCPSLRHVEICWDRLEPSIAIALKGLKLVSLKLTCLPQARPLAQFFRRLTHPHETRHEHDGEESRDRGENAAGESDPPQTSNRGNEKNVRARHSI